MVLPFADNRNKKSLASKMRMKRHAFFLSLMNEIPEPVTILDIGGTESYWNVVMGPGDKKAEITLLNKYRQKVNREGFASLQGDACNLSFGTNTFDIIFSNSVIEHVGSFEDQQKMASEVSRVGKRFFLQTPNRYFPIEPHFLFPFFQFLPIRWRIWLVRHFDLGWMKRQSTDDSALKLIESIRLLDRHEIIRFFPDAHLYEEKFLGFTKSFIIYSGWD